MVSNFWNCGITPFKSERLSGLGSIYISVKICLEVLDRYKDNVFGLSCDSVLGDFGGQRFATGRRIFRSKYVRDGYKFSCVVCVGALGGCPLFISL